MKKLLTLALLAFASFGAMAQTQINSSISGPSTIAPHSSATYTVSGDPSGAIVTWSTTGNIQVVGTTGNSHNVSYGPNQAVSVKSTWGTGTAVICDAVNKNPGYKGDVDCKTVTLTCPSGGITMSAGACGGYPSTHPHWRYYTNLTNSAWNQSQVIYTWSVTNGIINTGQGTSVVHVKPTSAGYFTVYLSISYLGCTYNATPITQHSVNDCDEGGGGFK